MSETPIGKGAERIHLLMEMSRHLSGGITSDRFVSAFSTFLDHELKHAKEAARDAAETGSDYYENERAVEDSVEED